MRPRWRFVARRSDGSKPQRGFTSLRAASEAKRRAVEQVERREVRHTKEAFGDYWERWLAQRKPYLEAGTWSGYEINGRKRLIPAFGRLTLGELSVERLRDFVADVAEMVEAGEIAAKTVNNTLATLRHRDQTRCSRSGGGLVPIAGVFSRARKQTTHRYEDAARGHARNRCDSAVSSGRSA
jgi:Phage integrase, N-terminal SAM-like domain